MTHADPENGHLLARRDRLNQPSAAAAHSFDNAAFFLERATQLLAEGAPADCPAVAQWVDFARRELWQGAEELSGREFTFGADRH